MITLSTFNNITIDKVANTFREREHSLLLPFLSDEIAQAVQGSLTHHITVKVLLLIMHLGSSDAEFP
jgi:hypothetical protein